MKIERRIACYAVMLAAGVIVLAASIIKGHADYYCGLATGLIAVSVLRLVMLIRYRKDSSYAKKADIKYTDERNVYIAQKSRSLAFGYSAVLTALASIAAKAAGKDELSTAFGLIVLGMMTVYLIVYAVVRKKS